MIYVCVACGTSYQSDELPPDRCAICDDERQYVPRAGQQWTNREAIAVRHSNSWREHVPGLFGIVTTPRFAIGQRAFLLTTPAGNILWDCIANLDAATRKLIEGLGGIDAIAVSHPHYYTTMQDWSDAFGAPVYIHDADRQWVMRDRAAIQFWNDDSLTLLPGVRLIHLGGHFAGGTVLHWDKHDGTLLVGDIIQITPGADRISFMWSYPNMLPLAGGTVKMMTDRIGRIDFNRMYGAFEGQDMETDAKNITFRSANRYLKCIEEA